MKQINQVKINAFQGEIKPHEYAEKESFDELSKQYQEDIEKIVKIFDGLLINCGYVDEILMNHKKCIEQCDENAIYFNDLVIKALENQGIINLNNTKISENNTKIINLQNTKIKKINIGLLIVLLMQLMLALILILR